MYTGTFCSFVYSLYIRDVITYHIANLWQWKQEGRQSLVDVRKVTWVRDLLWYSGRCPEMNCCLTVIFLWCLLFCLYSEKNERNIQNWYSIIRPPDDYKFKCVMLVWQLFFVQFNLLLCVIVARRKAKCSYSKSLSFFFFYSLVGNVLQNESSSSLNDKTRLNRY